MENEGKSIIIKRIKKAAHGHHGGAWKVAYADFVTAMMAFFLVMWIIGMSDSDKQRIEKYFNDPLKYRMGVEKLFTGLFEGQAGTQVTSSKKSGGVTQSEKPGGINKIHVMAHEVKKWMRPFESDVISLKVHPDRIQFAITASSIFSPGSVLLKKSSEPLLKRIAEVLKPLDASFQIEAHTDDLPVDSPTYPTNWELSAVRAATVVRYLIEAHYFEPSKLSAMAAGETRPIGDNRTPAGREKNRRIDIYIIPGDNGASSVRSANSQ